MLTVCEKCRHDGNWVSNNAQRRSNERAAGSVDYIAAQSNGEGSFVCAIAVTVKWLPSICRFDQTTLMFDAVRGGAPLTVANGVEAPVRRAAAEALCRHFWGGVELSIARCQTMGSRFGRKP